MPDPGFLSTGSFGIAAPGGSTFTPLPITGLTVERDAQEVTVDIFDATRQKSALVGGAALFSNTAAAGNVGWSVSVGGPGYAVTAGAPAYGYGYGAVKAPYRHHYRPYHRPAPVVYRPYVAPRYAPVYVAPRVYAPRRVVYAPPVVVAPHSYSGTPYPVTYSTPYLDAYPGPY